MFSKPDRRSAEGQGSARKAHKAASLIGDDLFLEGNLGGDGDVHLDGMIRGDVRVQRLTIGPRGCVEGAVTAETAEIHGRVAGSITARHVRLYAGAQVSGDITHEELTIEAGAVFQGRSLRPAPTSVVQAAVEGVGAEAVASPTRLVDAVA